MVSGELNGLGRQELPEAVANQPTIPPTHSPPFGLYSLAPIVREPFSADASAEDVPTVMS